MNIIISTKSDFQKITSNYAAAELTIKGYKDSPKEIYKIEGTPYWLSIVTSFWETHTKPHFRKTYQNKSIFSISESDVKNLIQKAIKDTKPVKQNNGGISTYRFVYDTGKIIGKDASENHASTQTLTVVCAILDKILVDGKKVKDPNKTVLHFISCYPGKPAAQASFDRTSYLNLLKIKIAISVLKQRINNYFFN